MLKLRLLVMAILVFVSLPTKAAHIVINNGGYNVIDYATGSGVAIMVRNVGCGTDPLEPWAHCASPGAATQAGLVDGGHVGFNVEVRETSHFLMSGGVVMANVLAAESSSILMAGGTTGNLTATQESVASMTAGTVMYQLSARETATLTWSGGSVGGEITAFGSAVLTIIGSDFAVDGVPVLNGLISAPTGVLTGFLDSGEPIDNVFKHGEYGPVISGSIILVPEPSTASLLALGLVGLAVRRRVGRAFWNQPIASIFWITMMRTSKVESPRDLLVAPAPALELRYASPPRRPYRRDAPGFRRMRDYGEVLPRLSIARRHSRTPSNGLVLANSRT